MLVLFFFFELLFFSIFVKSEDTTLKCLGNDVRVLFEDCLFKIGDDIEVDIRGVDREYVCCPKSNIIGDQNASQTKKCSDHPGYACQPISQCINKNIITLDGQRVVKVFSNTLQRKQVEIDPAWSICQGDLELCCRRSGNSTGTPKTDNPTDAGNDTNETSSVFDRVPSGESKIGTRNSTIHSHRCGNHNLEGIDIRITNSVEGDSTTQFGEWPHTCIIFYGEETEKLDERSGLDHSEETFIGGASLIAPGVVLTAAHKVVDKQPSLLTVRCGEWDIKKTNEPELHQDRSVEIIAIHPAFYNPLVYYDFALLFLTEEFVLAPHIDTICLPSIPGNMSEVNTTGCVATGFGKDRYDGQYQRAMKKVELPLVNNEDCQSKLRAKKSEKFKLHSSFICAGADVTGGDTCEGDGGGPLVCPYKNQNQFIQVGIVAWGVQCSTPDVPGVYASVSEGLCFIDWTTKCYTGDKYKSYYDINGCEEWITEETNRLKNDLDKLEDKRKSRMSASKRKKLESEINRATAYIKNADSMKASCI